ncbi:uncharacterized protein NECHADRAFT_76027 [Fusarium vanettenii 77-13-4]|uniref:DUF676 domain-containing protein n=1 Tax=Fusarium vanettenii (strain ATCC MYA-4622 / CBS 123669 / FGSC 9596 / NRRL 45880 / 77-13-4) TaxID=660122 RepID=C7Z698_FUSV7|nr:uncharacterized protein NECHADRAFT_76027 [Fusarium vanettenii 77-13-4]EEU40088.1 predicted protein [Fusarium vanettenii 77-13-4]
MTRFLFLTCPSPWHLGFAAMLSPYWVTEGHAHKSNQAVVSETLIRVKRRFATPQISSCRRLTETKGRLIFSRSSLPSQDLKSLICNITVVEWNKSLILLLAPLPQHAYTKQAEAADPPVPSIEREGITVLYGDENSEVDIVILHGLNGHPQSTWTHDSKFFWPWELKNKVKNARVMVFGYNADVTSSFADNLIRIRDIGRMLLSDLVVERQEDEERERPIIFMGHSLGGLVIKQAILLASKELHNQESDKRLIYTSTRGLFFFGTPHLGSRAGEATRVAVLKAIAKVAFVKVPPKLDSALKSHSDELNDLTDDFRRTALWLDQKLIIYSYYESFGDGALGDIVVDPASALTGYDKENSQPVQRNRQEMVKFSSKDDRVFKNVCGSIKAVMRAASSNVPGSAKVPSYPEFSMETVKTFVPRKGLLNEAGWGSEGWYLGIGGAGKSQLARSYLQEYGNKYDATFWIHAISPAALERSFQDIYSTLPNPVPLPPDSPPGKVRAAVLRWFFQNSGNWLLLFDEADGLSERDDNFIRISNYIPRGKNVHVIITSRSSMARDLSTYDGIEIRTLKPPEAVKLFLACAKIEGATGKIRKQAELIAEELGHLPLALTIAGSYVARTPRLASDLSGYLKEHRERKELLRQEPQQLIDICRTHAASSVCSAFFGNEAIYLDVLTWAWPQREDTHSSWCEDLELKVGSVNDLEECFSILEKYPMLQRDATTGAYSMHSLVHAWAFSRIGVKEPETFSTYANSTCKILFKSTARMLKLLKEEDTGSNRQVALQLVPHLRNTLQVLKKFLTDSTGDDFKTDLFRVQLLLGELLCRREYLFVQEIRLKKSEASLGYQHPHTIENAATYGRDVAILMGNADEGIKIIHEAAERAKKLGDEHPTVAIVNAKLDNVVEHHSMETVLEEGVLEILSKWRDCLSKMQPLQHTLANQQSINNNRVKKAKILVQEARDGPRRFLPLRVQYLETVLQMRAALERHIRLVYSIVQRVEEILADEDLRWYQEHRTLSSERLSALSLKGTLRGIGLAWEGLSVDLDKMVVLSNEQRGILMEIMVLSKKINDQVEGRSLWDDLKEAVSALVG